MMQQKKLSFTLTLGWSSLAQSAADYRSDEALGETRTHKASAPLRYTYNMLNNQASRLIDLS
jgi:hypothetical protein